ncbi:Bax inhibitor-1/YccA family protein [Tanticharoenia sakaeratensis]|uniref:SecY stabilizing membrane protein n=1 Tax=Tanticharoenia sakaeratensis NBRC 103193 TaxID=1231623 RepID=A0A0D6MJQ8_9PROT|nr:Bax inhibitor-1/YccA family protein [Tanticharoenia sakaeratensis]GAN53889.1 hypothetical protein Tasa_012_065 [Tanticharoenia sakaeratensis NBRC 103193]GBQ25180.1 hypothetical protein AA103193_2996 [Tanticharoenia sakaeratensis NBRC 103193]
MAFTPNYRATAAGYGAGTIDTGLRAYMLRVYNWMAMGLVVTGITAYTIAETSLRHAFFHAIMTPGGVAIRPTGLGYIAIFSPLVFTLIMSAGINRLSRQTVQTLFWAFCVAMGASLVSLVMGYTGLSIARAFFISAADFAAMSLWGYTTRADLSRFGSFLIMGLFGIVIASVVNIFMHSPAVMFIVSVVGVLVFTGLTAFDAQRIRATYVQFASYLGPDEMAKRSVYDALGLYLNFINLFQFILQFVGVRSNSDN